MGKNRYALTGSQDTLAENLPHSLLNQWLQLCLVVCLFLAGGLIILLDGWLPTLALAWFTVSAAGVGWLMMFLKQNLHLNRCPADLAISPRLGVANLTSIARGCMAACMAGFVLLPMPPGMLAWIPGSLYLFASLLDFLDGYLARRLSQTTLLGMKLDLDLDGLAVLMGCLLVVRYGQAPPWYLLVGLARYLFLLGGWIHQRRGLAVCELSHNPTRRALAGSQMGFLAAILLPLFPPQVTRVAASLFMLPFIIQFIVDFLEYIGARQTKTIQVRSSAVARITSIWVPLLLRASLVVVLSWLAVWSIPGVGWGLTAALMLGALLVGAGAAGRAVSMLSMISSGFLLRYHPGLLPGWLLLVASMGVFFAGTGRCSLWQPEDRLVFSRAGGQVE